MSSWGFAPRHTRLTFSGTGPSNAVQLAGGEPVRVWGFIVTQKAVDNNDVLTIETGDGSETLYSIGLDGRETQIIDTPFIADKGIRAYVSGSGTPTDIEVTFFHSHPGS